MLYMGIRCLNKFINKNCKNSKSIIHLNSLSGKKIVIDANIYMYQYASNNELIDGFYSMISIFKYYNIKPIFVFDGKSDELKKDTVNKRMIEKNEAEDKYKKLLDYKDPNDSYMIELRKKFTKLKYYHYDEVKKLIEFMGENFIEAAHEADEICAMLVLSNNVYGCLSEDTDMFVYGCKRIFKNINLLNHTVEKYDFNNILKDLDISETNFKQLCIISGTDYNVVSNNKGFYYNYNIYKRYKNFINGYTLYEWLYINNYDYDYDNLLKIYSMFLPKKVFENNMNIKNIFKNNKIKRNDLINLLKNYNFIFI